MRNLIGVIAAAAAAFVLSGCHADTKQPTAASVAPAPATPVQAPAPASANPAEDLKQAFAAAFGSAAPAVRIVTRDGQETTLRYRPARLIPIGGHDALISEARSEGCHGCYGELALHYLARQGTGFKVIGAWPEISDGGSFGEPPSWTVRDDLFDGPALVVTAGGTWQGCTVAYADLIELTPDKPVVRANRVLTTYDDGGEADGSDDQSVDGAIRAGQKGRAFSVDYTGAHPRKIEYRLLGETYEADHGAPGLPSC
ncbi:MAG TPA: hypothetical protein VGL66_09765 [Caulobacteraceae bacterium]